MFFTIRCEAVPGKLNDLDRWLNERATPFWTNQPGVKSFQVYGDVLLGYPERTIMIEVEDMASLQRILDSQDYAGVRDEFLGFVTEVESQILNRRTHHQAGQAGQPGQAERGQQARR
ncbi:MAG: hypothetical protein HY332_07990 [Chloroflexi bacterium]|nr:hypothetical protein [Chloroflexota bacterium]